MKSFNEWLENRDCEFKKNEAWWPFGKKKEPEVEPKPEERPRSRSVSPPSIPWYKDPKNQLKGNPDSSAECPHCGYGSQSYYGIERTGGVGECWKCKQKYWLDDNQQRSAKRMVAWDMARSRKQSHYEFDGQLYHTDPKGAARAAERAKNAIRADLSNI